MRLDTADLTAVCQAILGGAVADDLERQTLDFKRDHSDGARATCRLVADAAVCFANATGGTVVLGVQPRQSGPAAFVGSALEPDVLRRQVWELTDPHLVIEVEPFEFAGVNLLVVSVPESPEVHSAQGRAPRRIGTDCHDMSPSEQFRLREEKRGFDWSQQPSSRDAADVLPDALALARGLLRRHRDSERQAMARLEDHDLLRALGATRPDGHLSNAGELLFCEAAGGGERIVSVFRRTPGGEPADVLRTDRPLVVAFQQVIGSIEARRLITPVTLPSGQQIQIEDFPATAVREALSNAVIHRDYQLDGPVTVAHSPQVFEVVSPGPLVAGVTPENILTHESKPRNPALARAARILGLAEEVGVGVDRMYREMLFVGKQPPSIVSGPSSVKVTLIGGAPNSRIPYFLSQLPEEEREDVDTLLVLSALCARRTVDADDTAPLLQKPPSSAQAVLERLSQGSVGMLEPTRGTVRRTFPKYRLRAEAMALLGTAVRYNRRLLDELDRKVVIHVQEYGRITNKTVRNLLDVDVHRAAGILADLVERQILVKTSVATRGPSVAYGPGPQFPQRRRARPGGVGPQTVSSSSTRSSPQ
jgi:ATP-dependent DNA helicase RecG